MAEWTSKDVAARFAEAAETGHRLEDHHPSPGLPSHDGVAYVAEGIAGCCRSSEPEGQRG